MSVSRPPPATSRDHALWQQCWRDRHIDFHQAVPNPLLMRFWPTLAAGARVLVPLCGKSLDMGWLAAQGHQVVGVELSHLAIRAFFRALQLKPRRRVVGDFTVWESGPFQLWCGDYFALSRELLGPIDAVYDRAALTALPEDLRRAYVLQLRRLLPAACPVLLLTVEDAEEGESAEQTAEAAEEIGTLFTLAFSVQLRHVESVSEADGQAEHKVYQLYTQVEGEPAAPWAPAGPV
jgi:thiopurine S-methyltransferase